jgi:hypothetical protein
VAEVFNPGDLVEVRYLDETDREVRAYRGVVQGPAQRPGDYDIRVTYVFDEEMQCVPGDICAPILGTDSSVSIVEVN